MQLAPSAARTLRPQRLQCLLPPCTTDVPTAAEMAGASKGAAPTVRIRVSNRPEGPATRAPCRTAFRFGLRPLLCETLERELNSPTNLPDHL